ATYLGELGDHLQLVQTSASGPPSAADGVMLVSAAALAGPSFGHVFVLGAAEGAIPARLEPGARLDYVERAAARSAGLLITDATLAARREGLAFDAVMRAARDSLTLTYPESGTRSAQLPSPYFAALGLHLRGEAPAKPAASMEELRRQLLSSWTQPSPADDPVLVWARRALAVEVRRESA